MTRLPNSTHWQLIERTFRATDGRSWRRAAAKAFGIEASTFRSVYDRQDLSEPMIEDLHARLKAAAKARQATAEAEVLLIARAGFAVQIAQDERLRNLLRHAEDAASADARARFQEFSDAFFADLLREEPLS